MVKQFGTKLGGAIRKIIDANTDEHAALGTPEGSWVATCDAIGSSDPNSGPPRSAVEAVKGMIVEYANMSIPHHPNIPASQHSKLPGSQASRKIWAGQLHQVN